MARGLKTGDVVRLRSGGPLMTVLHNADNDPSLVKAIWFNDGERREDFFHVDTVDTAQPAA